MNPSGGATAKSCSTWRLDQQVDVCERHDRAGSFHAGVPKPLFEQPVGMFGARSSYAPTPDGKQFLVIVPAERQQAEVDYGGGELASAAEEIASGRAVVEQA